MTNRSKFLTVKDVASILQLEPETIYRYVECGKLQAFNFGHAVRISPVQFKQFCENNRRHSNNPSNDGIKKGGNDQ
jgi:excisionase family DNA binding protein